MSIMIVNKMKGIKEINQNQEPRRVASALAKYQLAELVDGVYQSGKTVIVQRYGKDRAEINPIGTSQLAEKAKRKGK